MLGPIEKLENGNFILESKIVELNQNLKKKADGPAVCSC